MIAATLPIPDSASRPEGSPGRAGRSASRRRASASRPVCLRCPPAICKPLLSAELLYLLEPRSELLKHLQLPRISRCSLAWLPSLLVPRTLQSDQWVTSSCARSSCKTGMDCARMLRRGSRCIDPARIPPHAAEDRGTARHPSRIEKAGWILVPAARYRTPSPSSASVPAAPQPSAPYDSRLLSRAGTSPSPLGMSMAGS